MAEHFGALALPVGEFLALEHGTEFVGYRRITVWGVCVCMSGGGGGGCGVVGLGVAVLRVAGRARLWCCTRPRRLCGGRGPSHAPTSRSASPNRSPLVLLKTHAPPLPQNSIPSKHRPQPQPTPQPQPPPSTPPNPKIRTTASSPPPGTGLSPTASPARAPAPLVRRSGSRWCWWGRAPALQT